MLRTDGNVDGVRPSPKGLSHPWTGWDGNGSGCADCGRWTAGIHGRAGLQCAEDGALGQGIGPPGPASPMPRMTGIPWPM